MHSIVCTDINESQQNHVDVIDVSQTACVEFIIEGLEQNVLKLINWGKCDKEELHTRERCHMVAI